MEDELARETASDSVTVAVSYVVMLLYIALALGTLPAGSSSWAVLVYSRVGVGLTGVMIVGLSVLAALGICSLFGMWATLIILEVWHIYNCFFEHCFGYCVKISCCCASVVICLSSAICLLLTWHFVEQAANRGLPG